MKTFVIYANCHANPIEFFLNLSNDFKKTYICHIVSILNYLAKPGLTSLNNNDIIKLQEADVVLCQYIQTDRNYLNHANVLSYCKPNTSILMMPHHRFSAYSVIAKNDFKFKINNWTFIPVEIYECYKNSNGYNEFELKFDEVYKSFKIKMSDSEIARLTTYFIDQYIKLNESQSSEELNMSKFVIINYKHYQLFSDDSHPTGIFFYELVRKILNVIGIYNIKSYDPNNDYTTMADSIWLQTYVPISDQEKDKLGLVFECFKPNVVMLNTASRKQAKSLCEYYYLHIINSLENKFN